MKALAKELKGPVPVLSQLTRAPEREDRFDHRQAVQRSYGQREFCVLEPAHAVRRSRAGYV